MIKQKTALILGASGPVGFPLGRELVREVCNILRRVPGGEDQQSPQLRCTADAVCIFDQAENRLHFQRALLKKLLG